MFIKLERTNLSFLNFSICLFKSLVHDEFILCTMKVIVVLVVKNLPYHLRWIGRMEERGDGERESDRENRNYKLT